MTGEMAAVLCSVAILRLASRRVDAPPEFKALGPLSKPQDLLAAPRKLWVNQTRNVATDMSDVDAAAQAKQKNFHHLIRGVSRCVRSRSPFRFRPERKRVV